MREFSDFPIEPENISLDKELVAEPSYIKEIKGKSFKIRGIDNIAIVDELRKNIRGLEKALKIAEAKGDKENVESLKKSLSNLQRVLLNYKIQRN
jgi:hypothetical protein